MTSDYIQPNTIVHGDNRQVLRQIAPESIACSVWSPPYHVGKQYEVDMSYDDWLSLLSEVICLHTPILKPGGFLVVNIADILCFKDPNIPRIMAENTRRKRNDITQELVLKTMEANPGLSRYRIAELLGCSEQTVDRRLKGNNIRGGKYATQTRVKLVGGLIEQMGLDAGLYLYDRRVWVKDAAWENSQWHSNSYRSVDEFEYIYMFWKPGVTVVNRDKLTRDEWTNWGSRAVWTIPSVRANDDHEAKFPLELPRRIIKLLTDPGDVILDCFVGSGTTAAAAVLEGRQYIGIDKEDQYVSLARQAVNQAQQSANAAAHTQLALL
jgi:site-specific DNA-methyltransferase (adenine-specific)